MRITRRASKTNKSRFLNNPLYSYIYVIWGFAIQRRRRSSRVCGIYRERIDCVQRIQGNIVKSNDFGSIYPDVFFFSVFCKLPCNSLISIYIRTHFYPQTYIFNALIYNLHIFIYLFFQTEKNKINK